MTGYITYDTQVLAALLHKVSTLHSSIEFLLNDAGLFQVKFAYNTPTPAKYNELKTKLYELVTNKSKYDVSQISDLNNDLTRFMISFANIVSFGPSPINVSIEISLMEYILFLYAHL